MDPHRRAAPGCDLVILDCDGVLVDSEPLAVRTEVHLITELGWPISEAEVIQRFLGRSDQFMFEEIEHTLGRSLPELPRRYEQALQAELRSHLTPVEGVLGALDALDALGIPTCVASSGTHDKMRLTLGLTGLWERFAGRIFSSTEVARGKPAPDLFLHAAGTLGVPPGRCVVVEDSPAGVLAARAAGMRCIAYAGGLTPAERLVGPDTVVIGSMRDFPDALA